MKNLFIIYCLMCCSFLLRSQTLLGPGELIDNSISGFSAQVVEIDHDGDLDIAIIKSSNLVYYANDGNGNFGTPNTIVASSSLHFQFADLDGDADNDLVFYDNNEIRWLSNNGSGTFGASTLIEAIANNVTSTFNSMLITEDLDNDGDQDVILVTNTDNTDDSNDEILYYLNNGSGVFSARNIISTSEIYIEDITTADLNNDGNIDIVFASSNVANQGALKYLANDGSLNFLLVDINTTLMGADIFIDVADYDLDGNLDVLASSSNSENIVLFENNNGSFSQNITIDSEGQGPADATFADINNDGFTDVISGYNVNIAAAFLNISGNGFTGRQYICLDEGNAVKLEKGDFNGDGNVDILAAKFFGNNLHWFENIPLYAEISVNNLPCTNACNGSVNVSICAPYFAPYTYQWIRDGGVANGNGTANSEQFTIDNLCAGDYEFIITDALGSSFTESSFILNEQIGAYFEISGFSTTNTTNAQSNGSILVEVLGGSPNYTYTWNGPVSGSQSIATNSFEITNLSAGDYIITVSENAGANSSYTVTVFDENVNVSTCDDPLDVIILNDVSGSVDETEYGESKQFFVDFVNALNVGTTAADSRVAIIEWSATAEQNIAIPITGNVSNLQNYNNATRVYSGGTNPQDALTFGRNYLASVNRPNVPGVLVLSTDAHQGQVSGSLISLANQYKSEGYYIVTIAFDEAFSSTFVSSVLQAAATSDGLVYGAPAYSLLTNDIAETIANQYVCPIDPGSNNSVFFDRDGTLEINSITEVGFCPNPTSINVDITISAEQQLAIPTGTPITFYYNNPNLFGATSILTYNIPCAIAAGDSENLTIELPVTSAANIFAVLNDDGSQTPPINFPITDIEETIYQNNIDNESICTNALATLSVQKYTTTPIPVCGDVVIYNVDVCNISNADANGVVVTDVAPVGAILLSESVNLNGCSIGNSTYNIPAGCCVSVVFTYDVSNVNSSFYSDQDALISGPATQEYINFDGASTSSEDVLIGTINCTSDVVSFSKSANVTEICEESFVTYTFTIDNQTNVDLLSLNFSDDLPSPVIWAAEPYNLNGLNIGSSNITGSNSANFTIDFVHAETTATFQMDAYLGNWTNNGTLTNTANLDGLPDFVNGNGSAQSAISNSVDVYALPTVDAVNLLQINSDETALLESTITNGINPVWVSDGDGSFINAQLEDVTYIPGNQDIEDGIVHFIVSAESPLVNCGNEFDTVLLEITKVYDWGDAPDNYKTLNISDGARHFLVYDVKNAMHLGSNNIDDELDGLPVSNGQPAVNDDNTENNDEDGISAFPNLSVDMTGNYIVPIQVENLLNSSANIYGWIDFDRDGEWTANEFATSVVPSNSGLQTINLTFTLPGNLDIGITYARFRITSLVLTDIASTTIDERSFGFVTNGEVEDYDVTIVASEICDNGIDDDGDNLIDENDPDCADCLADFAYNNGCFGDEFSFDASNSFGTSQANIITYQWDFGDGTDANGNNVDHNFNSFGDFDVMLIIEDDSACIDTIVNSVSVFELPNVSIDSIADFCLNESTEILTQGNPANGIYVGNGIEGTNTFNPSIAGVGQHEIFYVFEDSNNCKDSTSVEITVFDIPNVTFTALDSLCIDDDEITLTNGSPIGGIYQGNGIVGDNFDPQLSGVGSHSIQYVFQDVNGCIDTSSQNIVVLSYDRDTIDIRICSGDSYVLTNGDSVFQTGFYPDTILNVGLCGTIEVVNLLVESPTSDTMGFILCGSDFIETNNGIIINEAGIYFDTINLSNNCDSIIVLEIERDETICENKCILDAPSAFTPNNDGDNDVFYIINPCNEELDNFELRIYNRWGEQVYISKDISQGWNGQFKNVNAPLDVYTYFVRFSSETALDKTLKGTLTLIR